MDTARGFIVASAHSRSGKTTVTLALMAALRRVGVEVAPFKAGPDYIDPAWHRIACERDAINLDTFMVGRPACRPLFEHRRAGALGIIEGVMGLYDGKSGIGGPGSTADLAKVLDLPVVLVVEARGMAGSIAPLVDGFVRYAEGFRIAGVIANRVGGAMHVQMLKEALASRHLPPLLAALPRDESLTLEERHLGLILPGDRKSEMEMAHLAEALVWQPDDLLTAIRTKVPDTPMAPLPDPLADGQKRLDGQTIAVARDAAFCFIYRANLDWLAHQGAEVRFFSPIAGDPLPAETTAAWLPGGYPELHCKALFRSKSWETLATFVQQDGPLLAECGGMMALGRSLTDKAGQTWPMAGILDLETRMTPRLAGLGYRQEQSGPRGHEFHHSKREPCSLPAAFQLDRGDPGVRHKRVRASYVHWYFPSAPEQCASWLSRSMAT
ncbi:MAG: cobyrinate a,c-diamide synthase [Magnetococcales bacterium]|nr:cobyrinate a,c-diamide synthase [Magnetococcales bacterium]